MQGRVSVCGPSTEADRAAPLSLGVRWGLHVPGGNSIKVRITHDGTGREDTHIIEKWMPMGIQYQLLIKPPPFSKDAGKVNLERGKG